MSDSVRTGLPDMIMQIPQAENANMSRCYGDKYIPGDAVPQPKADPFRPIRGGQGFYHRIFYEFTQGSEKLYIPITFAIDTTEEGPVLLNERVLGPLLAAGIVKFNPRTKEAKMNAVDGVSYEVKRTTASHNNANVLGSDVLSQSGLALSYGNLSLSDKHERPIVIVSSQTRNGH